MSFFDLKKHYRFPTKRGLLMKAWIKATGIVNPNARICGYHFTPDDYWEREQSEKVTHKYLKRNAVPSLLLPILDVNVDASLDNHSLSHDMNAEPSEEVGCFSENFC